MIQIPCPHCGPRNRDEFSYLGEALDRPSQVLDMVEWRTFLYTRSNPAGWAEESWFHRFGCRKVIVAERHTVTNEVRNTWMAQGGANW